LSELKPERIKQKFRVKIPSRKARYWLPHNGRINRAEGCDTARLGPPLRPLLTTSGTFQNLSHQYGLMKDFLDIVASIDVVSEPCHWTILAHKINHTVSGCAGIRENQVQLWAR
jgi:hypothetical protein